MARMQSMYDEFDKGFFIQEEGSDADELAADEAADMEDDDIDETPEEEEEV